MPLLVRLDLRSLRRSFVIATWSLKPEIILVLDHLHSANLVLLLCHFQIQVLVQLVEHFALRLLLVLALVPLAANKASTVLGRGIAAFTELGRIDMVAIDVVHLVVQVHRVHVRPLEERLRHWGPRHAAHVVLVVAGTDGSSGVVRIAILRLIRIESLLALQGQPAVLR